MSANRDVNGDGFADLVVGAPLADTSLGDFAGKAYLFGGDDLFLRSSTADVSAGDDLTLVVSGAEQSWEGALVVTEVDGSAVFFVVARGRFRLDGSWLHTVTIPPDLGTHEVVLSALASPPGQPTIDSNSVVIQIR